MAGWFNPGEPINEVIRHVANTTGITLWTKALFVDGVKRTDLAITISEIGSGFYRVKFTPDVEGLWRLNVNTNAAPTVFYGDSYIVKDIAALIGGVGYDSKKHSLTNIRGAVQINRDELTKLNARNRNG